MRFETTSYGGTYEILAADEFKAIPAVLTATGVVYAGTPITAAGIATTGTGSDAVGILLYDVDCDANPNCALVVEGIVDFNKCKEHSGVSTMTVAGLKTALPGVVCRTNIGVNE